MALLGSAHRKLLVLSLPSLTLGSLILSIHYDSVLCGDYCVDIDGTILLLTSFYLKATITGSLRLLLLFLRFVLYSGVGSILGGIGGDALFKAGEGQGHQRHNQPAGVPVPQREYDIAHFSLCTSLWSQAPGRRYNRLLQHLTQHLL